MQRLTETLRLSGVGIAAIAATLALIAWTAAPKPAAAQFFFGFPRFYAPFPYYPPPAYYPYYPPAPAYYPPPAPGYGAPPAPAYGAAPAPAAAAQPTAASITYTDRAAFKNAAGQTCREFKAANGALGTACQDAGGQWRVAN